MRNSTKPDSQPAPMDALLLDLVGELYQTERSAALHCAREAKRYEAAAPALVLREVAGHARYTLAELGAMATAGEIPTRRFSKSVGQSIGAALSHLRAAVLDRMMGAERSYRATLLGIRHGVDLVRLIEYVALGAGRHGLAGWCSAWLAKREPLLERAADELVWFAENPMIARTRPRKLRSLPA